MIKKLLVAAMLLTPIAASAHVYGHHSTKTNKHVVRDKHHHCDVYINVLKICTKHSSKILN